MFQALVIEKDAAGYRAGVQQVDDSALPAGDVLGRPVITLLFPEDEGAASMFEDAPVRMQMRARRKDGVPAEVDLSISMVHGVDGRLTHWVLAFADRSEIARMREELRILRSIEAAP